MRKAAWVSVAAPQLKPLSEARNMRAFVEVAVIGRGYVGVPLAAAVAATGGSVVGVDIAPGKVGVINVRQRPVRGHEPGLESLLKEQVSKHRLRASLDPSDAANADG